jgi:hypothetical protein
MCGEVTHAAYEQRFRLPIQGESLLEPDPGLKPGLFCLAISWQKRFAPQPPPRPQAADLPHPRLVSIIFRVNSRAFAVLLLFCVLCALLRLFPFFDNPPTTNPKK